MTALTQYDRLESGGLWRAAPDAQRRDVTVSFGDATLVISDGAGRPLTHWSLPAVIRQNVGTRPAIFAPDTDASETLEIDDDLMINAIEKVRKALVRNRVKPGKLRHASTIAILVGLAALAVFWLPGALTRQALSVVPLSKRSEIGATVLGHLQQITGRTCRGAQGTQALSRLQTRLMGANAAGQIVVVPSLAQGATALPGGIILLDRSVIEQHDDVAVAAGYIIAAAKGRKLHDPLGDILDRAGLRVTFGLLTTGDLPTDVLRSYAEVIATAQPAPLSAAQLRPEFAAAQVPSTPYAQARGTIDATDPLVANDPLRDAEPPVILPDRDWVSLQGICTS